MGNHASFIRKGYLILVYIALLSCAKSGDRIGTTVEKPQAPKSFYVAPNGDDQAAGTRDAPLRTVNAVMDKLAPGDTVLLRGGHYYEQVKISRSGAPGLDITFKAYPGEVPVIDGSHLSVSGWQALITMDGVSHITLDGLEIADFVTSSGATDPEGIKVTGAAQNIHINRCKIYNIKNNAPLSQGRSGHAILVIGTAKTPISGLEISYCTVHDTQTGTSENITLAGNVDGFNIHHNTVYHTENIGIIIAGGDNLNPGGDVSTNYARNGVVSDNVLYNVSMANSLDVWGDMYGAIAIYVCGGAGTIIERNTVYNCDRGIGLISESNLYASKDCIVRNNFVYRCWRTGIYMGDYLNFVGSGTKNCYILNNTLFQNDRMKGAFGEIEGEIRLTEHCDNNVVLNNLVYGSEKDVFVHKYTKTGSGNKIDYNLYYAPDDGNWLWESIQGSDGGVPSSFSQWQKTSGQDLHSLNGIDPGLQDLQKPDLHVGPRSAVKNTGHLLDDPSLFGQTDIDGRPRITNGKISIGAQQL